MITNADITLYQLDKATQTYTRLAIEEVFWSDSKQSNVIRTGMVNADAVLIMIPASSTDKHLQFTTGRDLVVKGIIDFEIDNTSQETISKSIKRLHAEHRVVTVTICDEKLYGSESMQHYKLSCK